MYDPAVGRWDRRTEREKIAGTGSRRQDFDESRLSEEYVPEYEGQEKLGAFSVHKMKLTVKEGIDVAFPVMRVWIDVATNNLLMSQEYALSGKLMRTSYYSKWQKVFDDADGQELGPEAPRREPLHQGMAGKQESMRASLVALVLLALPALAQGRPDADAFFGAPATPAAPDDTPFLEAPETKPPPKPAVKPARSSKKKASRATKGKSVEEEA